MKIGLYGIQGVYNFGCEAIVRGAYKFFKTIYPESEIFYYSYSYKDDSERLKDLNIKIREVIVAPSLVNKIEYNIQKKMNCNHRVFLYNAQHIIDSMDVVVSIGGDIYTIPEIVREKRKYCYYNSLVDFCDVAIKNGKDVVVYGASIGPWGKNKKALEYYVRALKKYKLIICRESESIKYLNKLGINNVVFFPDPAFSIRDKSVFESKQYIGVNLSPLSLKEIYGNYDEKYILNLAMVLDELFKTYNMKLMFIPHVISSSETDNDLIFMKKIQDKMKFKDKVVFADSDNGFIGVKKDVKKCYLVISARMHCAINAIDENVPVIFLSYSQKSVGMCKYVYGNDEFCINLKSIDNCLLDKVQEVIDKNDYLVEYLKKRNNEIQKYYNDNISKIQALLNE